MRRILQALPLALALIAGLPLAAAADPPERVVSINVCADQYLLALADPDQIAALSLYAADAGMAYFADRARRYPRTAGNAEEVLAFDPDLVLAGTFTKVQSRAMLRRLGYRVIDLAPADSWDDVRAQTRLVAEALGHPGRAERWIAALDTALAAADGGSVARGADGAPLQALQYQRRGFTAGTETLMDRIFAAAGLENAATEAGIGAVGRLSMESLVRVAPDLVVFDRADIALTDVGSDLLRHPALDRAVPEAMQMVLPQRLTVCGGPSLAEAVATLRAALRDRFLRQDPDPRP
ncbi:MAG: ABC transporter substrate-binding protein [Alphaproteobacteria bacterium]|nr:ABC transporter substrate-binding protein [Alphaproteobacteria bacterium]